MTDNDRELLELAARAAGFKNYIDDVDRYGTAALWVRDDEVFVGQWAPLTDDGDALRLAVKLNMGISIPAMAETHARVDVITFRNSGVNVIEDCKDDPYAATRRAIVRAAAEIGRNM